MVQFKNPHDPDNIVLIEKIQEWVRAHLLLSRDSIVQTAELACSDPGCVDLETRISVTEAGSMTRHYRIHKPLVFVRKRDIELL